MNNIANLALQMLGELQDHRVQPANPMKQHHLPSPLLNLQATTHTLAIPSFQHHYNPDQLAPADQRLGPHNIVSSRMGHTAKRTIK